MAHRFQLRAAASLLAVLLSGCGGGGGAGAAPTPPEPPAQPQPGPAAFMVIGQKSFAGGAYNQGGSVAADTLFTPIGNVAFADNGTMFISDTNNGRVLTYPGLPTSSGASASSVIGKPTLTAAFDEIPTRESIVAPVSVSVAGGRMAVADTSANRVLIYSTVPTQDGPSASFVVGQSNFTNGDSRGCFSHSLQAPRSAVLTPNGKLVIADTLNHRVLIWNNVPDADGLSADVVVGQSDFTSCARNDGNHDLTPDSKPDRMTLNEPYAVWSDGQRLIVADTFNHRVLIWNRMPLDSSENFKPADIVLGQLDFSGHAPNDAAGDGIEDDAAASTVLYGPGAVHSDGVRLVVADSANHRVLVWNRMPTASGTPADRVFGQADFNRKQANDTDLDGAQDTSPSAHVLYVPRGVFLQGDSLFVSDAGNHRLLVFRMTP